MPYENSFRSKRIGVFSLPLAATETNDWISNWPNRLKCRRNIRKFSNVHHIYTTTSLNCLQIHLIRLYMLPVCVYLLIISWSKRKSMPNAQYQMNRKWCKCPDNARIICSKYLCIKIESDGIFDHNCRKICYKFDHK